MQVSHSYYEDEIRDGFYVHGMMKRAWAASIEVLEVVDAICKKHNITYFADAGTLLGAVRHKGFIPWDDDLDICMKREDYNHFLKVAKDELPEQFEIINIHTVPEYNEIFSRVVNGTSISFNRNHLARYHGFPFVVGIDIFPLDYIAPNEEEEQLRCSLVTLVEDIAKSIDAIESAEEREAIIGQVETMCGVRIDRNGHLKNQLMLLEEKLMSMYGAEEATELALMPIWARKGKNKFKKGYYESTIDVDFENTKIPLPSMYDAVLREKYGDYMKLVHNWDFHNYPFYGDQIQIAEEGLGFKFPKYEFNESDLLCEGRQTGGNVKEQAEAILTLLKEAHGEIQVALSQGNVAVLQELLEACQNGAIAMGTMLEESQGEGFATVGILEAYCEYIYQVYGEIMQGIAVEAEEVCTEFNDLLGRIDVSIHNDIQVRKEVVFLPYKVSMWNAIESVWKAACEDADCDVYVIPVPYYEKNTFGEFAEMHYEGNEFPDYVPITRYDEYDLVARRPDKIFIQSPYDGYGHGMSIAPAYYASNIKQHTEELIYIPYFVLDEIDERDARAVASMDYFVTMPGVVHADKVIVQSEVVRKSYIEALVRFAGEDTRTIWENKILGLGSPLYDKLAEVDVRSKVPREWKNVIQKEDGERKKVILYYISASSFEQSADEILSKIQRVLETFRDNKEEVTLLWYMEPWAADMIKEHKPEVWDEYQCMVKQFQEEGWGIYDDTASIESVVQICDAYYGDTGNVAQLCRVKGIPVMLQDVEL